MNDREAFKFGFISRCIDAGFTTPTAILDHIKSAAEAETRQHRRQRIGGVRVLASQQQVEHPFRSMPVNLLGSGAIRPLLWPLQNKITIPFSPSRAEKELSSLVENANQRKGHFGRSFAHGAVKSLPYSVPLGAMGGFLGGVIGGGPIGAVLGAGIGASIPPLFVGTVGASNDTVLSRLSPDVAHQAVRDLSYNPIGAMLGARAPSEHAPRKKLAAVDALAVPKAMLSLVKSADPTGILAAGYGATEVGKGALGLLKDVGEWAIPAMAVGPGAIGYGLGHLAGKVNNQVSDSDVESVKNQELIDEYGRQASRLRREGALRRFSGGANGLM